MNAATVIEAIDVRRIFRAGQRLGNVAVDNVCLKVDTGSIIGLVGESGSGKTTIARILVGLERPGSGSVTLDGIPVERVLADKHQRLAFRRAVQFVGQDTTSSFDPRRSLRDSMRLPACVLRGMNRAAADDRVDEILRDLGIWSGLAERRPHEVSGGQRQRFAIGRALIVEPRILVCDEVVSALDASVQGAVLNLLKRYCSRSQAGMLFVSHSLPAAAFMSTTLSVMYRGKIIESGPSAQVLQRSEQPYTRRLLAAFRVLEGGKSTDESSKK